VNATEINLETARPFIERWHYSERVPTGQNQFFGIRLPSTPDTLIETKDMFGDVLYAVADYGIGVNPYQAEFIARESGRELRIDQLVELKRLCRVEPRRDDLPLTKFISMCNKALKKQGIKCVVAFSDPEQGHSGGIYRAASFTHMGATQAEVHLVGLDGKVRHRRFAYRHARRNGIHVSESRDALNMQRIKTAPKDRWVKWL
jgi:hypothetical protein|tara:strand:- start:1866 stop:2474 length:609 start_codon:yes stop_codon:yes gene_type:complete